MKIINSKNLKFIFYIISISMFIIIQLKSTANEEVKTIRVGIFNAPPLTFENESHEIKGSVVDFYKNYVFNNMPYKFTFEILPYPRLLDEAEKGNIDIIAMTGKDKVKRKIIVGNSVIFKTKNYLITRKDFPYNKITSVEQIKNYTIWLKKEGSLCAFIANNLDKLKTDIPAGDNSLELVSKKLFSNRVDAIYGYSILPPLYFLKKEDKEHLIKLVELPGDEVKVYAGYSEKLPKNFIEQVEKQIQSHSHIKQASINKMIINHK